MRTVRQRKISKKVIHNLGVLKPAYFKVINDFIHIIHKIGSKIDGYIRISGKRTFCESYPNRHTGTLFWMEPLDF